MCQLNVNAYSSYSSDQPPPQQTVVEVDTHHIRDNQHIVENQTSTTALLTPQTPPAQQQYPREHILLHSMPYYIVDVCRCMYIHVCM